MKLSLYTIAAEYRQDIAKLADLDLDEATLADTLEGMGGELQAKATNVAMFARDLEATAASIKDAEAQMAARRKAIENRAAGLRRYLLTSMQVASVEKIECPYFKLSIKKNPAAVEVFDLAQLPTAYMRKSLAVEIGDAHEVIPDDSNGLDWLTVSGPRESFKFTEVPAKDAIKAAINAKQDVPGCKLTQGVRLDIA